MKIIELKQKIVEAVEAETNLDVLEEINAWLAISQSGENKNATWELTEEFQEAIKVAESDIENGNIHLHEDVIHTARKNFLHGDSLDK